MQLDARPDGKPPILSLRQRGTPHMARLFCQSTVFVGPDADGKLERMHGRCREGQAEDWPTPRPQLGRMVIEVTLASFERTAIMLMNDGSVFAVGHNLHCLLGQETPYEVLPVVDGPLRVPLPGPACKIATGYHHAAARLLKPGPPTWFAWGRNVGIMAGVMAPSIISSPVHMDSLNGVTDLWCGNDCNFAVFPYHWGTGLCLRAWGINADNRLGLGVRIISVDRPVHPDTYVPLPPAPGMHVKRVASSDFHTICLLASDDGKSTMVVGWGLNYHQQLSAAFIDGSPRTCSPLVIHDSATDDPPCVIVDAIASDRTTVLLTSGGDLLIRGWGGVVCGHGPGTSDTIWVTRLSPVTDLPVRGIRAALDYGGWTVIGRDNAAAWGELWGPRDGKTDAYFAPGSPSGRMALSRPYPSRGTLAAAQLWRLPAEIKALVQCWWRASKSDASVPLGWLPRDLIRVIVGWVSCHPLCITGI